MTDLIESENLIVEFLYTPSVNYAIQQNKIPLVRKLKIENISDNDIIEFEVRIQSKPDFTNNYEFNIDILPAKQNIILDVNKLRLSSTFLSELTEKINGELILSIISKKDDKLLFHEIYDIDILAFDQWNGIGLIPEIIASFITPNHPEISKILFSASGILDEWTGNPSFDGYQTSNPDRVKKQMAAIYEVISKLNIVYCSPPASFELEGQRIRMCDTIFSQNLGTCIDMSLLFAASLEAIGLNPLIVILKGHAFVGCWLIDEYFPDSINDDVSLIKKRIAVGINEIGLVEATYMNAGHTVCFDVAMSQANYKLVDEESFILFVDIKRARLSGVKPLPQRVKILNGLKMKESTTNISGAESNIPEDIFPDIIDLPNQITNISKQQLWERKLLDLSLRNNLLNLRVTRSTIQLISVNLNLFEDSLADGTEFQILSKPEGWSNPIMTHGVYQKLNNADPIIDLIKNDINQKRLRSYLTETELNSALTKLYRTSKSSIEENGANTLYLALGFLKWFETPRSEKPLYAPLLLLPVEIVRKSAKMGYVIRSREEDTILNITLLEKLRQDFGITISGLEELPRDDSGVDVKKIFNIFRHSIMSQSKWDLEEFAFLGTFSFNKFIMWNDIHNNSDKLSENKIVSSLISGKIEWNVTDFANELINLDKDYKPNEIILPISADSSQFEAIYESTKNKSFILHGPPGTGKSQTITNIIANALYQGKKVLFVAEKMAALEVVQRRLEDIGIGPYCLELHSNKAKKSTVLEHLLKTTEVVKKTTPLEYQTEANRLYELRIELNSYVESLHKKHSFGFSLFDCFNSYAIIEETIPSITLNEELLHGLNNEKFIEYSGIVEELKNIGTICNNPYGHPLSEINALFYSQSIKNEAKVILIKYIELLNNLIDLRNDVIKLLDITNPINNSSKEIELIELIKSILSLTDIPKAIIQVENIEQYANRLIEISKHGIKRDEIRLHLLKVFKDGILKFDAQSMLENWELASNKWIIPKILNHNKVLKSLNALTRTKKIKKDKVVFYLELINKYNEEQNVLNQNQEFLRQMLEFLWNGDSCEWEKVIQICESIKKIHFSLINITSDPGESLRIRESLSSKLASGIITFKKIYEEMIELYIDTFNNTCCTERLLFEKLSISLNIDDNEDYTKVKIQKAGDWLDNIDGLRDWVSWNMISEKAVSIGLSSVVDSYKNGQIPNEYVVKSFHKGLYSLMANNIISSDPNLSAFNGKLFESKISKYNQLNNYFQDLTRAELFAKIASIIPSFTLEAAQSSEIGILQRALRSKGRGISLRNLFDSIPNLLPRLCPCMLMSPISVAQYFPVDKSKFDLIIFDEASQLPTSEAVGAISRGENLIVVGDPKQMPPTSFFSANKFDEENYEFEDLESILDDCLALSIPSKHLLWHYRSKHESLIAFSNSQYYDNKLMTFPSPDDLKTKVNFVHVPGYYDRGKTRQNRFEAEAIVYDIIRRLSDPELSKRSIGVVTFSIAQQNLIDDLLNEAFQKRPELDSLAMESIEPIFIKNLENVQGDERDVILFSVGYGPDKEGRISLNFGPLNRDGGWRRLNVAVSRARYEMTVFSTLRPDQIDITRTTSDGVLGMKSFLEYSEKGKMVLPQVKNTNNKYTTTLENIIAEKIREFGYEVNTNIGCSGYKIDLGVVNPSLPNEYLLGILTDGDNYKSAQSARDREIIRPSVLKSLGWNIYKLWSTDWWENSNKILTEILDTINKLMKPTNNSEVANNVLINKDVNTLEKIKMYEGTKLQGITQHIIEVDQKHDTYNICDLPITMINNSDDFFWYNNLEKIHSQIHEVISKEAPINKTLLSRRIINAWGISRLGVRLNEYLDKQYVQMNLKYSIQDENVFYWREDQDPSKYKIFRLPADDYNKRNAEDLPQQEVAAGIVHILSQQISLPYDDLIREASRFFGYARLGSKVDNAIKLGLKYAVKDGLIVEIDKRYVLN